GLTGAMGMALEVAWTRVLGVLTSNSAYCVALVLTVMLLGLGLGALIQWGWLQWHGGGWHRFAVCQCLLAAVTLGTVPLFRTAPAWLERASDSGSVLTIFLAELTLTATALLV